MTDVNHPAMTAGKAHWTAVLTALTSIALAMSGVVDINVEAFSKEVSNALTLIAAALIQAAVAWATTYYKRNHPK